MLRHGLVIAVLFAAPACKKKPGWTETGSGSGSAATGSGSGASSGGSTKPAIPASGNTLGGGTILSVGADNACAYTDSKKLWCWKPGQPAEEVPAPSEVIALAGAQCGLLDTGELWCWGPKEMKVAANTQSGGQIAAAAGEVCVGHRMDMKCWKIGDVEPHAVWGFAGVDRIALGDHTLCSAIAGGTVECSDITQVKPSHDVVPGPENIMTLAMGGSLSCGVIEKTGAVSCWVDGRKITKVPNVKGATGEPGSIAVGPTGYACAIVGGGVTCWHVEGANTAIVEASVVQIGGVRDAQAVGAGSSFGCAINGDGKVVCWGSASKEPGTAQGVSKK
jgi:hypothetical protein